MLYTISIDIHEHRVVPRDARAYINIIKNFNIYYITCILYCVCVFAQRICLRLALQMCRILEWMPITGPARSFLFFLRGRTR